MADNRETMAGGIRIVARSVVTVAAVMLGVSIITFAMLYLAPGDPADILLKSYEESAAPEALADLKRDLGIDRPAYARYFTWLKRAVVFDFGRSFKTGEPVKDIIFERFPATLALTVLTFGCMVFASLGMGIAGALCRDRLPDILLRVFSILIVCVPVFWLGLVLLYVFSLKLDIFPLLEKRGVAHLILPVVTLGAAASSIYGRTFRAVMIDILQQDYIKLARVKGAPARYVVGRHIVKNAMIPMITLWGMSFGGLLGGSVIVEKIFSWPGLGSLALEAIFCRDYPVILGYVVFMALVFVTVNTAADGVCRALDPRIRYGALNRG